MLFPVSDNVLLTDYSVYIVVTDLYLYMYVTTK